MEALTDKTPETSNQEVSTGHKQIYTTLLFLLLIVGALLYYKGAASIAVIIRGRKLGHPETARKCNPKRRRLGISRSVCALG